MRIRDHSIHAPCFLPHAHSHSPESPSLPPPYVIAEIGVNHDGSPDLALQLTDAAADAGADAVKLQLFEASLLLSRTSRLASYQAAAGEHEAHAMLRRLELPDDAMARVVDRAHSRGIAAIVTVFSLPLVDRAQRLHFDAYKTASPDIVHRPLLEALALTGKPLIVSTGAATLDEVARCVAWLGPARERLALLHCVSSYPTPEHAASLGALAAIRSVFRGPLGYSDHTRAQDTGALAVAAGATILEKHLTHSRAAHGPDHAASLEPGELREYVRLARRAHDMLGPPAKRVHDEEREVRHLSRQSIVAARDLPAGTLLTHHDLSFKRPGTGLEPWRAPEILGRRAARDIPRDTPIDLSDAA